MSKKKKAAVAIGVLALIGVGLWATTAKADDDERPDDDDDDNGNGGFKPHPAVPGDTGCPPGQIWSEALGECVDPFKVTPAEPGEDPTVIVNRYLGPGDRDRSLYQIKSGDRPERIAKRVLHAIVPEDTQNTLVAPYVAQMAIHSYNLALYSAIWGPDVPNSPSSHSRPGHSGRPSRPVAQRYTAKEYDPEGVMRRWYIGDAFFSRKHEDNLARLRGGNEPLRTTDEHGRKLTGGNSYGLIWLPMITGHRIGMHATVTVEPGLPADLASLAPNIYG